jgi:NADH-quinone oxidoreductase subunit D
LSLEMPLYSPWFQGPLSASLEVDGDRVISGRFERGYAHKGIENLLRGAGFATAIPLVDRIDPEGAPFTELALCLAVETLLGVTVSRRAENIRVVVCELTRVSQHLKYLSQVARAVSADTFFHYALRDRERVLGLLELLTGARFCNAYLRVGGVYQDVTEGFIEQVLDLCDHIQSRVKEYNDLLSFNSIFLGRTTYVGVLHPEMVREYSVTGPAARASGVFFDLREHLAYSGYSRFDFTTPLGSGEFGITGDAHDRVLIRLREIIESFGLVRQALETLEPGLFRAQVCDDVLDSVGRSDETETTAQVESARGVITCFLRVNPERNRIDRAQFIMPSLPLLSALPALVAGARIEDLSVIFSSMDVYAGEVDR